MRKIVKVENERKKRERIEEEKGKEKYKEKCKFVIADEEKRK